MQKTDSNLLEYLTRCVKKIYVVSIERKQLAILTFPQIIIFNTHLIS
jgi:hypothetical protein